MGQLAQSPFAAEWTETVKVFGVFRDIPAHDFYECERELIAQVKRMRAKGITQVTLYKRVNGELVEFDLAVSA